MIKLPLGFSLKDYYLKYIERVIDLIILYQNLLAVKSNSTLNRKYYGATEDIINKSIEQLKSLETNYLIKQFKYMVNTNDYLCVCSKGIKYIEIN